MLQTLHHNVGSPDMVWVHRIASCHQHKIPQEALFRPFPGELNQEKSGKSLKRSVLAGYKLVICLKTRDEGSDTFFCP